MHIGDGFCDALVVIDCAAPLAVHSRYYYPSKSAYTTVRLLLTTLRLPLTTT
ncbi:hypothetical protein M378DRAFT_19544 [Amanita muscaria Koide BX008]|uniref:Uncharacterized protein n=1 Tax=Amanita muscaria (strain Koide BX008) TaxID=946122 RepID=A0A0C2WB38_AMAMK|nr:hypothetical protein M378DRAFT_19544 [Amanita muscaria Koide BX008]